MRWNYDNVEHWKLPYKYSKKEISDYYEVQCEESSPFLYSPLKEGSQNSPFIMRSSANKRLFLHSLHIICKLHLDILQLLVNYYYIDV